MSSTLPGADVRGYYRSLGVELPEWARTEAPVRCFADPDAHAHQDRDPSCSVNIDSGAFNCHGCGARGGAYDAALAVGRSPREAIELMVAHGLTERRPRREGSLATGAAQARERPRAAHNESKRADAKPRNAPAPPIEGARTALRAAGESDQQAASSLSISDRELRRWARAVCHNGDLLARLGRERGWEPETLARMGIGFDGDRITVPVTDERGTLQGLLRVRVENWQKPKVLAAEGTRLGLIPHPELVEGSVVLVEGPSDLLAARSAGLPAIAVPGTHAWRAEWGEAFAGRGVTVVMDCDRPGREAAARIAWDLERHGAQLRIVDLAPERDDGYDLSDWLQAGTNPGMLTARWYTSEAYTRIARPGGDVWTVRPRRAEPPSASPRGPVPAGAATPGSVGMGMGCAAF